MISDTVHSAAGNVWLVSSALAIVCLTNNVFDMVVKSYDAVISRASRNQHLSTSWDVLISINTVKIVVGTVACVGGLSLVLRDSWTERITSSLVVGVGFGLQGAIQDTTWGYFRRTYPRIMHKNTKLELIPYAGSKPITGSIEDMHISSFVFVSDNNRYVLPWSVLRSFKYTTPLEMEMHSKDQDQ